MVAKFPMPGQRRGLPEPQQVPVQDVVNGKPVTEKRDQKWPFYPSKNDQ